MRGNTGEAPLKALDHEGLASGGRRWRFIPLKKRLDTTSARPAALPTTDFQLNLQNVRSDDTNFSHFAAALVANAEINITATFSDYLAIVQPLSLSLPLLFRNRRVVVTSSLQALRISTRNGADATVPIANCLTALGKDLGPAQFHPFFPEIVSAFADVFDISRHIGARRESHASHDADGNANAKAKHVPAHSVMWDPDSSMVPIFATLAEITKDHLQFLARDPAKTVKDLLPLLTNSHYRVREMTAEACLGYLMRKTRDLSVLKHLTTCVLDAASDCKSEVKDAVDGFGVTLFEAVRLPGGRLHPRAIDVLAMAIQHLCSTEPADSSGESPMKTDEQQLACLSVVARCFAGLCRHVRQATDMQSIAVLLVTEAETALRTGHVMQVGNVCFLLRKWLRFTRGATSTHLGISHLQRVLNVLSACLEQFKDDARVVSESFEAICFILSNAPQNFRQQSIQRTMSTSLDVVSKSSQTDSILAVLSCLRRAEYRYRDIRNRAVISKAIASLCEQLAKISSCVVQVAFTTDSSVSVSELALRNALDFARHVASHDDASQLNGAQGFSIPTLEVQIKSILLAVSDKTHQDSQSPFSLVQKAAIASAALEYLCLVQLPKTEHVLEHLFKLETLNAAESSSLLDAFASQFDDKQGGSVSELYDEARRIAQVTLKELKSTSLPVRVLRPLDKYFKAHPRDAEKIFAEDAETCSLLTSKLSEYLSSENESIRRGSAALLMSLTSVRSYPNSGENTSVAPEEMTAVEDDENREDDVRTIITGLRSSLIHPEHSLRGLYKSFSRILEVQQSMDRIDSTLQVLFELTRLVQKSTTFSRAALLGCAHFSIGLLRTPFKTLWPSAASLWCAVAGHDHELAMSIIMDHLSTVEKALILEWSGGLKNRSDEEGNYEDTSEEGGLLSGRKSLKRSHRELQGGQEHFSARNVSKKQRAQDREQSVLQWNVSEWKQPYFQNVSRVTLSVPMRAVVGTKDTFMSSSCTDNVTFIQELLRTLMKDPKHTLAYRRRIIDSYLDLDPSRFSRRTGDAIAACFAQLLEKMGGLKCSENNKDVEHSFRTRLYADLCRPGPILQTSSLRCLCVSRSPFIKPHRDSFIRLLEDSSFREELALITDTLFSNSSDVSVMDEVSVEKEAIVDILIRICFSKMRGKRAKLESRRSAVLSFIVSKLPWNVALPKLTNLALEPLLDSIDVVDVSLIREREYRLKEPLPLLNIQRGVLSSIESILRQCRRVLPLESATNIAVGTLLLLREARSGSGGQDIRSRCLRLLAEMLRIRPEDSSFLIVPTIRAVKAADFGTGGLGAGLGTPAFLHFMAAVLGGKHVENQPCILSEQQWAVDWCVDVMRTCTSELKTAELSLEVARGLLGCISADAPDDLVKYRDQNSEIFQHLTSSIALSLQTLLRQLLEMISRDRGKQRTWSEVLVQTLQLIKELANMSSSDGSVLITLAEALSTYVSTLNGFSSSSASALTAYAAISRRLCIRSVPQDEQRAMRREKVKGFTLSLIPLFGERGLVQETESYGALCDALSSLDVEDMRAASACLRELNAMKASRLSEPDLDRRIEALNQIIGCFKAALEGDGDGGQSPHAGGISDVHIPNGVDATNSVIRYSADSLTALCYGCVAAVKFEDSAVRGTASYALELMAKWAGRVDTLSASSLRQRMFKILLTAVISSKQTFVRREYCRSFGKLVRTSKDLGVASAQGDSALLRLLKPLANSGDPESDILENLGHLQAHRRSRALRRLEREALAGCPPKPDMASDMHRSISRFASQFSLPLGMQIALEVHDAEEEKKLRRFQKATDAKEDARKDVSFWAVSLVGASARWLPFQEYKSCLSGLLRRLKKESNEQKSRILYQLLVKVVEAFPKADGAAEDTAAIHGFLVDVILPQMLPHISVGAVEGHILDPDDFITKHGENTHKGRAPPTIFRAQIAICIGQLMTQLPESELETTIPLLVTPLSNALRSRMTETRDSAKKALTVVALMLGSKYFSYILRQVLSALSQGSRKDACVYVLHALLIGIKDKTNQNSKEHPDDAFGLDESTTLIAEYLADELESGILATRSDFEDPNASTTRQKQAVSRASRAYECAELLAEQVTFSETGTAVFEPFENILTRTTSTKLNARVDEVMKRIIAGFSRNKTLTAPHALKLSYSLISRMNDGPGDIADEKTSTVNPDTAVVAIAASKTSANVEKMAGFGLELLVSVIGKSSFPFKGTTAESRELQAMLEPFVPKVATALQTRHDSLTLSALKASQILLRLPLANKADLAGRMSETIVNVLAQSAGALANAGGLSASSDLFNTCLRCAAILLHEVGTKEFNLVSKERVEALLNISCSCIENGSLDSRSAALSLLKAVVSSRIIIPAVYDAMEKVNKLAIRAQSTALRSSCTSLSVAFLISFPLGSKRVRQHLEFFVRNLNYELANGRLAAIEAIKTIILKFPADILENECEYLFIALAASASRDTESACRAQAAQGLQLLFERLPVGRKITDLLQMGARLAGVECSATSMDGTVRCNISSDKAVMRSGMSGLRAACKSGRMSREQLHFIARVLVSVLDTLTVDDPWETTYATLSGIEIVFTVQPKSCSREDRIEAQAYSKPLWLHLPVMLLHVHQWIRLSSARLLGSHLSVWGGRDASPSESNSTLFSIICASNGLVRSLLKSLCLQLEANELSEELGQQCLKNVLCLANVIFSHPSVGDVSEISGRDESEKIAEESKAEASGNGDKVSNNRGLRWLLSRMSGLALKTGKAKESSATLRRACAIRFLLVTAKWWGKEVVSSYKLLYINPVVQILESKETPLGVMISGAGGVVQAAGQHNGVEREEQREDRGVSLDDLKSITLALQEALVENIGTTEYYDVYHELRTKRNNLKDDRKRQAAFALAIDPERAAKKRRKRSEAKKKKKNAGHSNRKPSSDSFRNFAPVGNRLTEDM